ncbi:hypothetical protein NDU88_006243 [Pleurodeles waltl]|uniref:Uncharacterized protein n=1 Tax=Pleurodeles waltl TaxID=8319 RepID=A0AAV7PQU1_PLEWA|nr:hypothetical protein NDU88_006243 [Pleurodeles waltl]
MQWELTNERGARRGMIVALQQQFDNPPLRAPSSATLGYRAEPIEPAGKIAGKIPNKLDLGAYRHALYEILLEDHSMGIPETAMSHFKLKKKAQAFTDLLLNNGLCIVNGRSK